MIVTCACCAPSALLWCTKFHAPVKCVVSQMKISLSSRNKFYTIIINRNKTFEKKNKNKNKKNKWVTFMLQVYVLISICYEEIDLHACHEFAKITEVVYFVFTCEIQKYFRSICHFLNPLTYIIYI